MLNIPDTFLVVRWDLNLEKTVQPYQMAFSQREQCFDPFWVIDVNLCLYTMFADPYLWEITWKKEGPLFDLFSVEALLTHSNPSLRKITIQLMEELNVPIQDSISSRS